MNGLQLNTIAGRMAGTRQKMWMLFLQELDVGDKVKVVGTCIGESDVFTVIAKLEANLIVKNVVNGKTSRWSKQKLMDIVEYKPMMLIKEK